MWNEQLAACVKNYASAILTTVDDATGYPRSVRCVPRLDATRHVFTLPDTPPFAANWRGKACLLFHTHNDHLEELRQVVVKGDLGELDGVLTFTVNEFVTANWRCDSDVMPHAGAPLHMLQFLLLGRRKARAYLAKRGAPWPPIPYAEIDRALAAGARKGQERR